MTHPSGQPGVPRRHTGRRGTPGGAVITLIVLLLAGPLASSVYPAQLKFNELTTKYLRIVYYDEAHEYVVPHLGRCYENTMGFYRNFFGYTPSQRVTILLQDFDDYGYAGTSTIPNNYITLGIEPYEHVYETSPTNERLNWVMNHELVHVVASEKAAGADNVWRAVFHGKVGADAKNPETMLWTYLTNPRRYAPRWYHEGIAVFLETWLAGGLGRALGGYDEMVFRTMVNDNAYFYDVVGLESEGTTSDFQVGQNSYLYGTRFMSYLALHYGPEKVVDWVNRREGTSAYFARQFRRVFGRSLHDEWRRWIAWEHDWQTKNLRLVREYPVTRERPITHRALGSASRAYYDENTHKIYAAVNYPGDFAHIVEIDSRDGSMRRLCDIETPALYYVTSLAFDEATGTLFFTTNNGRHWRDLNSVDVRSGHTRQLIANDRVGDLTFSGADSTLWGVQHHNGQSILVRIRRPYNDWSLIDDVFVLPYGRDLFDIDVSPDGKWLTASMSEINGEVRLIRLNTHSALAGNAGYDVLWEFDKTAPANFVFSRDGKRLYGTAYQTGVSNVFRYDFAAETMDAVTNVETGYFRPVPMGSDSLLVYRYAASGLRPVVIADTVRYDVNAVRYLGNEIVRKYPVVESWKLGSPRRVNLDSVTTYRGEYHKLRNTRLGTIYPVVEGYKDYGAVGLRMNFMDPLGLQGGNVAVSVTPNSALPDNERVHAAVNYQTFPWTLQGTYNRADFYDLFGPRRTSRKGYSATLTRHDWLIADKPRTLEYTAGITYYAGLDEVPFSQDVPATYSKLATVDLSLDYRKSRHSIGYVDDEKGHMWDATYSGNLVNGRYFSLIRGGAALGGLTPIAHSSLWLRGWAGYSFGDAGDTFANFYFGGFQNNWVDHQDIKRYRQYDTFPGVDISEISGTRFGKAMLEWTLPPWRFERLGVPILYTTWMRTALFAGGIVTNFGNDAPRERFADAGVQVDFRLVLFSGLPSTLSFGYAAAVGDHLRATGEFMVSLKIL